MYFSNFLQLMNSIVYAVGLREGKNISLHVSGVGFDRARARPGRGHTKWTCEEL